MRLVQSLAPAVGRLVRTVGSGVRVPLIETGHRHAIGIEHKIGDAMLLANIRAASRRVPEQPLVELVARYLPGLRLRHVTAASCGKIRKALVPLVTGHEGRAPLLRKAGAADDIIGADGIEHVIDGREQRFTE